MISVIHEHSVDLDILRKGANILDLGARGMSFTKYFDERGDYVVPVDMDLLKDETYVRPYVRLAVTNYNGTVNIKRTGDKQATAISKIITNGEWVNCVTLEKLSADSKVSFWDLIKMDIEGSELEVIMSLTKAPAKQLSIEFHLHTGVYNILDMRRMELKLKDLGYKTAKHEMTNQHSAGFNFWDSLYILK